MTKPLLAILLLLPLSVSAGELDGKGIICVCRDERIERPFAIEFKNGVALRWVVWRAGTVAKLRVQYSEEFFPRYRVSTTAVQWAQGNRWEDGRYVLDRKTLVLEDFVGDSRRALFTYDCNVSPSLDAFQETLELDRLKLQTEIEASMKDNKI